MNNVRVVVQHKITTGIYITESSIEPRMLLSWRPAGAPGALGWLMWEHDHPTTPARASNVVAMLRKLADEIERRIE